jgi:hypothetical protein
LGPPASAIKDQVNLLTYPNPVGYELRIAIADAWLTYQLMGTDHLIKQSINNSSPPNRNDKPAVTNSRMLFCECVYQQRHNHKLAIMN